MSGLNAPVASRLRHAVAASWRAPRALLVLAVRGYRLLLSPWIGQSCRFTPTCSVYAIEALQARGAVVGTGLATWRILRCNPLCAGGCDPVPHNTRRARSTSTRPDLRSNAPSTPGLFTSLMPRDPGAAAATVTPAVAANDDPNLSKTPS